MSLTMYDSVDPSRIPSGAQVVAGYADGLYAWTAAGWGMFPNAVKLTIAVRNTTQADILDVERGDASPDQVPGWVAAFNRPGRRAPTVYCTQSTMGLIRSLMPAGANVDYWVANHTATPQNIPGTVAVQWLNTPGYDQSLITDETWVAAPQEDDMSIENARITAWGWYPSILRRLPTAQAEVEYWAGRLVSEKWSEQVVTDFCDTPEAKAALHKP